MNQPIRDLELIELIGEGRYGSVYRAAHAEFGECAVRIFRPAAINRRVVAFALQKAISMQPNPALMRVLALDLGVSPGHCVTELLGEPEEGGKWKVTTLRDKTGRIKEKDGWNILYEVAGALDHLHRYGIAHCDVAARNIIFHREDGALGIKVTGFGLGRMADVPELDLGEEALRLAPEQLKRPEGIYEGAAFGWDVYSFGVLAYRILTGRYPRGEEYWKIHQSSVAGAVGVSDQEKAAAAGLVSALIAEPEITWADPPADEGTRLCREIAERCLQLDPASRPVDLREVREEFDRVRHRLEMEGLRAEVENAQRGLGEAQGQVARARMETSQLAKRDDSDIEAIKARAKIEAQQEVENARSAAEAEAKAAEKRLRGDAEAAVNAARNQAAQLVAESREQIGKKIKWVKWGAAAALVGVSALIGLTLKYRRDAGRGGLASSSVESLQGELETKKAEVSGLEAKVGELELAKVEAERKASMAIGRYITADNESQTLLSRLIHFGAGVQGLAEDQVKETLTEFESKLEDPSIQEDKLTHARTLHDVAVMRRRLGDNTGALEAFVDAGETFFEWLNGAIDHPARVAVLRRLAHCEEASYQLFAAAGRADEAIGSLKKCTGVYDSLLDDRPEDHALVRRSAELHFVLAQYLRRQNRIEEALEAQGRVVDALAGLEDLDDPPTVLAGRILRARIRYETGLTERQKGDPDRAIDAQIDATEQLVGLVNENPGVVEYQMALALCYTELGELVGRFRNPGDAKDAHNEAVRLLIEIVQANLRNDSARFHLARNYGELALIDRDEGDLGEAYRKVDGAVQILTEMVNRIPGTRAYVYRLALYKALKAEILTEQEKRDESIKTVEEAVATLEELAANELAEPVERKEYKVGLAGAYESSGFALIEAKKEVEAKESFTKAVALWKELAEAHASDKLIAERLEKSERELKQFDK